MEDYKLIFSWVAFYKIHLPFTFLIRIMLWTKDKLSPLGTSLAVWWLRLCTSNAGGMGSIPGWGTKIPYAVWHDQKKKKKIYFFLFQVEIDYPWKLCLLFTTVMRLTGRIFEVHICRLSDFSGEKIVRKCQKMTALLSHQTARLDSIDSIVINYPRSLCGNQLNS